MVRRRRGGLRKAAVFAVTLEGRAVAEGAECVGTVFAAEAEEVAVDD